MDVFFALAEPTRRSIIEMLAERGQLSATAIAGRFHSTPSAISQHLKVLREARLVSVEKRNQQRLYSLNTEAVKQLEDWARQMSARYDALEAMIDNNN
ncbi:MAG TPA: metalloregulator ArsR/SmtB family transcription factor [Candidatus Saccharimonadia bacterium]|jgi:DNA-binding transcriptional ArsR family regulator